MSNNSSMMELYLKKKIIIKVTNEKCKDLQGMKYVRDNPIIRSDTKQWIF